MSLVLNTNIDSLIAQNSLTSSGGQLTTALQQLSSGLQINTAADNAAGYAISQGMTSQINGLNQASQNANDGVSLTQTAQGALTEITNDLQTMRDLAVQSLNGSNSSQDRLDLNQQFQQLAQDINQVASTASFNGVMLLDGSFQGQTFQIGANAGQTITVASVASVATNNLGALYTAAATDPAAYTSDGTATGTAVANGDSGSFTLTVGGKQYTTAAVSLTGTQSTDLATIAAAITQATGNAGVVATVDSTGKGINLSSTTGQTVTSTYTATTGSETLATFGLTGTSNLSPQTTYAATGATSADTLSAGTTTYAATGTAPTTGFSETSAGTTGSATLGLTIGGTNYSVNVTGLGAGTASDLTAIQTALNADSSFNTTYTASVSGGKLVITGGSSAFSVTNAAWSTLSGVGGSLTTGFEGGTGVAATGTLSGNDSGTASVVIGGTTYTTGTLTGFNGTASNDVGQIAAGLNAVSAFSSSYTASVDASGNLVITGQGGGSAFTVTSATFTPASGTDGINLGLTNAAAAGSATGAGTSYLATANVDTMNNSNMVLIQIDAALQQLATTGAQLGAYQNRFQSAITGLQTDATNLSSAKSQIVDTNYAQATSNLSKAQILQQASTAMVAQANTIPQQILTLLQKLP